MPAPSESHLFLHDGIGLWAEHRRPAPLERKPALFLDRDGVIVTEVDYLGRPEDIAVIPGVPEAIAAVNSRSIAVVMVTNQSGIARRYYGWPDFRAVQERIHEELGRHGAHIDLVLACGYHEVGEAPLGQADHPWRKPNPGMLIHAAESYGIDLGRSWIIGDRMTDLRAGERAGLAGGYLVRTGYGEQEVGKAGQDDASRPSSFSSGVASDAAEAISQLLARGFLGS